MNLQAISRKLTSRQFKLGRAAATVALGLLIASSARAADLFWDANGTGTGGGGTTAPGTWGTSNFWSTDSTGASATGAWTPGENAVFSAGTNVTGTYAVTVSGTQSLGNLTIQEGTLTFNGGELTLNGGLLTTPNTLTINSVISGAAGLNKLGGGTLNLTAANTYSGTTFIGDPVPASLGPPVVTQPSGGIVVISNNNALGTSDVNFIKSRLIGTTVQDAYTGRLYLTNNITVANNITLTNGSGGSQGPGQLDNLSGNNTLTGTISLAGASNNIGNGLITIGAQAGTMTISGVIQNGNGTGGFAKVGPGTLVLTGDSPNTHTGLTRVFGGYLIAEKNGAFGSGAGGMFMLGPSGISTLSSFGYQGVWLRAPASSPTGFNYSIAETGNGGMSLAGFANDLNEEGLFHNVSGDNTYAGDIQLGNVTNTYTLPTQMSAAAGSSVTITGKIQNPVATPPNLSLRNLTKIGGGSIIFTGFNTHIGTVFVENGTLSYKNNGSWTPSGPTASFLQVGPNGTLRFDNTDIVNTIRFTANATGPVVAVNIDGGKFQLVGSSNADTFQGVVGGNGPLPGQAINAVGDASFRVTNPTTALPPEQAHFTTSLGTAPSDFNQVVGGVNRSNRGTMLFRGDALGTAATGVSQVFLDPSLSIPVGAVDGTGTKIGILPFATGDASGAAAGATGFVTYGANGVRHLDEATEYASGITSGSSDLVNVTMNTPQAVLTDTTVNSIRMTTGGNTIVISDLAGLVVNSGAILNASTDAASIRNGTLNFGAAEGVITNVGDMNITSVIMGSNGLTKSGRGTLTLAADNQFSGALTINGGNLVVTAPTQLGPAPASATPGSIVLNGGFLKPQGSMTLEAGRGITTGSLHTGFDVAAGETLTVAGAIDGPGSLTKVGAGTLVLAGNNSFRMGMNLNDGVVSISSDSQLGTTDLNGSTGIMTFNGGTLRVTDDVSLSRNRGFYFTSRNGKIDVADGKTFDAQYWASGPGGLIKSGKGKLILGGAVATGTYFGSNQITDGTLAYQSTLGLNALPPVATADYWKISNGATLQMLISSAGTTGFSQSQRGITLVGAGTIDLPSAVLWNVPQIITGTGTLTKTGDGELRLAATNTYNGKTSVLGGTLSMAADTRLGAVVTAPDSITLDGGILAATASFTLTTGRGIKLGANNGTLKAANTFALTYGGVISGAGNLTKDDLGTVILSGASTYTGTTRVNAGILRVNGSLTGGGDLTVVSGATLQGTGTVQSKVLVTPGGHLAPGASVGTLTTAGLSLDTSLLDFEGNASGFDRVNITGADKFTLANTSTINLTDLGGVAGGAEYIIIDYAGTPLPDLSGLALASPTLGSFAVSLVHDTANTLIKLRVAAAPPPQWNVDANGSWGNDSNWSTFVQPNSATDIANFLGKITAARTVSLDGAKTVNGMNFDNTNTYTIAAGTGGSLTVSGGGAFINVNKGTHVIAAPVTLTDDTSISVTNAADTLRLDGGLSIADGRSISKKSAGTLTIAGLQSHGAGSSLQVGQGTVNLASNAGTAASAGSAAGANLSLNISNGGGASKLVLGSHQDVKEVTLNYTDSDTQGIDLNSSADPGAYNALRIYASDLDGTRQAMWNAINNARTNAGDGVYDSGLVNHANAAIGVANVIDPHGDKLVMVRATRIGDLNLDGQVSISDFIDLASNFNASGAGITWQEGDLNGDNTVSISDFIDLAANFNGTYSGSAGGLDSGDVQTLASFASSLGVDPSVIGSAVPEPGTLSLLALGGLGLLARRRRR